MSSRHVEEGAGREYADPRDATCDYCGKVVYTGLLHQSKFGKNSLAWLCDECFLRSQSRYDAMVGQREMLMQDAYLYGQQQEEGEA